MKTAAVVVHWGPREPTVELCAWLAERSLFAEVVVVANDLSARPRQVPELVDWLVPPRNLGFGAGVDLAARTHPGADAYLLLNNDVRLDERSVRDCLELLADDGVGVVGPTLLNARGLQSGGGSHSRVLAAPRVRRPADGRPLPVEWVTGAAMFVRGECYHQVRMDGRYFLGFEDADFCRRARRAGWSVLLATATAWHGGGGTIPPGRYVYYIVRNRLWFVRRHSKLRVPAVACWAAAMVVRVLAADALKRRGTDSSRLALHGLLDGLGPMPAGNEPRPDEPRAARWATW